MPKGNITGSKVSPEENLLDKPAESLISTTSQMTPEEFEHRLKKLSNVVAGAAKTTYKIYSTPIAGAKFCGNIFALIAAIFCKAFASTLFPDLYKNLNIEKKVDEFIKDRGQQAHDAIAKDFYKDTADGLRQILQKEQLTQTPRQVPSASPAPVEASELTKTFLDYEKQEAQTYRDLDESAPYNPRADYEPKQGGGRDC